MHTHLDDPLGRGTSESYFTTLSSVSVRLMGRLYYEPPRMAEMRTHTQITQRSTWYKGVGSSLYGLILLFHQSVRVPFSDCDHSVLTWIMPAQVLTGVLREVMREAGLSEPWGFYPNAFCRERFSNQIRFLICLPSLEFGVHIAEVKSILTPSFQHIRTSKSDVLYLSWILLNFLLEAAWNRIIFFQIIMEALSSSLPFFLPSLLSLSVF